MLKEKWLRWGVNLATIHLIFAIFWWAIFYFSGGYSDINNDIFFFSLPTLIPFYLFNILLEKVGINIIYFGFIGNVFIYPIIFWFIVGAFLGFVYEAIKNSKQNI